MPVVELRKRKIQEKLKVLTLFRMVLIKFLIYNIKYGFYMFMGVIYLH